MPDLHVEHIAGDEITPWLQVAGIALLEGGEARDDLLPWARACTRYGVRDGGRLVASAGHFVTELTLPGGVTTPAGAVTMVGVLPTHRRRGVLTAMMVEELRELREQGCSAAVLLASEAMIYGRYGYGATTRVIDWQVDTLRGTITTPPGGPFRMLDRDEAAKVLPEAFERFGRRSAGAISRPPGLWEARLADLPAGRHGFTEALTVVHEAADGSVDGYVRYRLKDRWDEWLYNGEAVVLDACAADASVEADLWRYLLSLDLITRIEAEGLPPDHVLPWLLDNPRAARAGSVHDGIWLRPIEVAELLGNRIYPADGTVSFGYEDPLFEDLSGGYTISVSDGAANVERGDIAEADVYLTPSTLGSLLLGGYPPAPLVQAGLLDVRDDGALLRLTRLFATDRDPWCNTHF